MISINAKKAASKNRTICRGTVVCFARKQNKFCTKWRDGGLGRFTTLASLVNFAWKEDKGGRLTTLESRVKFAQNGERKGG